MAKVSGKGGPRGDKIPIKVSDGEYVLPADTTQMLGAHNLDRLVEHTHKFADGGLANSFTRFLGALITPNVYGTSAPDMRSQAATAAMGTPLPAPVVSDTPQMDEAARQRTLAARAQLRQMNQGAYQPNYAGYEDGGRVAPPLLSNLLQAMMGRPAGMMSPVGAGLGMALHSTPAAAGTTQSAGDRAIGEWSGVKQPEPQMYGGLQQGYEDGGQAFNLRAILDRMQGPWTKAIDAGTQAALIPPPGSSFQDTLAFDRGPLQNAVDTGFSNAANTVGGVLKRGAQQDINLIGQLPGVAQASQALNSFVTNRNPTLSPIGADQAARVRANLDQQNRLLTPAGAQTLSTHVPTGMGFNPGEIPSGKPATPAPAVPAAGVGASLPGVVSSMGNYNRASQDVNPTESFAAVRGAKGFSQMPNTIPGLMSKSAALPNGQYQRDYTSPWGTASGVTSAPPGRGTLSVMDQGNGGTIEGNVAALDRQTAALRSLREAANPGITTGNYGGGGIQEPEVPSLQDSISRAYGGARNADFLFRTDMQDKGTNRHRKDQMMQGILADYQGQLKGMDVQGDLLKNQATTNASMANWAAQRKMDVDKYSLEAQKQAYDRERNAVNDPIANKAKLLNALPDPMKANAAQYFDLMQQNTPQSLAAAAKLLEQMKAVSGAGFKPDPFVEAMNRTQANQQ